MNPENAPKHSAGEKICIAFVFLLLLSVVVYKHFDRSLPDDSLNASQCMEFSERSNRLIGSHGKWNEVVFNEKNGCQGFRLVLQNDLKFAYATPLPLKMPELITDDSFTKLTSMEEAEEACGKRYASKTPLPSGIDDCRNYYELRTAIANMNDRLVGTGSYSK